MTVIKITSNHNHSGLRPLDPGRDLTQLAFLIESAFGDDISVDGRQVLRDLRFLGWLGPLNVIFTNSPSEVDGILTGFVWIQDRRVVGNVTVNRPTGHSRRWQISNVAVLSEYRGRGIGRQLVQAALDMISERGGDTAYLFVRDDNPPAIHLYQSMGFGNVDRATDLIGQIPAIRTKQDTLLRPLRPQEGEQLYHLVLQATGPGHRWLYDISRNQYVISPEEWRWQAIEGFLSGRHETRWGLYAGNRLDAALIWDAARPWSRKPHRLKLWVRPDRRGLVEKSLISDLLTRLALGPRRPIQITLPHCEQAAIQALVAQGFRPLRTLILMKKPIPEPL